LASTEPPLFFDRWMIPDTDRAAARFLLHVIRAAGVDQPERVVGQSCVRFQVRPCGGLPVPSATKAAASWLARRVHTPHRRGTLGRPFPAVTTSCPGRRLAGLTQGSSSSSSVPRRRALRHPGGAAGIGRPLGGPAGLAPRPPLLAGRPRVVRHPTPSYAAVAPAEGPGPGRRRAVILPQTGYPAPIAAAVLERGCGPSATGLPESAAVLRL